MADEIRDFKKQLDGFEHEIWSMEMNARALQEHRADFPRSWIDTAIENVNFRYLDPHQEDVQETLATLKQQQATLQHMIKHLQETYQLATEIRLLTMKVVGLLEQARREIESAEYNVELSQQSQDDAGASLKQAQAYIKAAKKACS